MLWFDVSASIKGTIPSTRSHWTLIGMTLNWWPLNKLGTLLTSLAAKCAPGRISSPFCQSRSNYCILSDSYTLLVETTAITCICVCVGSLVLQVGWVYTTNGCSMHSSSNIIVLQADHIFIFICYFVVSDGSASALSLIVYTWYNNNYANFRADCMIACNNYCLLSDAI